MDLPYPRGAAMIGLEAKAAIADGDSEIDEMEFAVPIFKRDRVNKAGRRLVSGMRVDADEWGNEEWYEYIEALDVINNWRSSHAYPLLVMRVTLSRYAKKADPDALIAQRIKRLISITAKLTREPRMKLSQMQDIGGCRAVVSSMTPLLALRKLYQESDIKHQLASFDDYIKEPRTSGYRGLHLVYRYRSDKAAKTVYNDLKIELQLRSQYQHAWATAVETVGTFIGHALKSSIGPERWLRFFQLMGSAIAIREGTPIVPHTGGDTSSLYEELRCQAADLNVSYTLASFSSAVQTLPRMSVEQQSRSYYYLLRLNARTGELTVEGFPKNQSDAASTKYLEVEKEIRTTPGLDAVLVSVNSLSALERAYPNYFGDTRVFVELMSQALSGREEPINAPSLI